jgi:hypothetical protein
MREPILHENTITQTLKGSPELGYRTALDVLPLGIKGQVIYKVQDQLVSIDSPNALPDFAYCP